MKEERPKAGQAELSPHPVSVCMCPWPGYRAHLDEGEGRAWWQRLVLVGLLVPYVLLLALLQVELVLLLQVEDGSGGHCNYQCLAGVFLQDREERGVRRQQRGSVRWSKQGVTRLRRPG